MGQKAECGVVDEISRFLGNVREFQISIDMCAICVFVPQAPHPTDNIRWHGDFLICSGTSCKKLS